MVRRRAGTALTGKSSVTARLASAAQASRDGREKGSLMSRAPETPGAPKATLGGRGGVGGGRGAKGCPEGLSLRTRGEAHLTRGLVGGYRRREDAVAGIGEAAGRAAVGAKGGPMAGEDGRGGG